jgi:DnaJ-class molecular chaperone
MFFHPNSNFGNDNSGTGGSRTTRTETGVADTAYYDTLGVPVDADETAIKKAYRKAAIVNHPDKGGDAEKFKVVSEAYSVLSDPDKRAAYDRGGKSAVQGSGHEGAPFASPDDIFDMFFGGGGPQASTRRSRKGKDMVHRLEVSLEDMYRGKHAKLAVTRTRKCDACSGRGGEKGEIVECGTCGGKGQTVEVARTASSGTFCVSSVCGTCSGKGRSHKFLSTCDGCAGRGTKEDRTIIGVTVKPGCEDGERVVFEGEGHDGPPGSDVPPGDIVVILVHKDHPVFERLNEHLLMKHSIDITQALCGFSATIKHVNGKTFNVYTSKGVVVEPGSILKAEGKGMKTPTDNPVGNGDMYIIVDVVFPKEMSEAYARGIAIRITSEGALSHEDPSGVELSAASPAECFAVTRAAADKSNGGHRRRRHSDDRGHQPCHVQ